MQPQPVSSAAISSAADLFALTDEQILQIEPDVQDVEVFAAERSDSADPLRADLDLLASGTLADTAENGRRHSATQASENSTANANGPTHQSATNGANTAASTTAATDSARTAATEAPAWLAARMNDPQNGMEARALWDGVQAARQEASAFREVFAKPADAHAAAERARTLDDFDRAYFGAAGSAPEQLSASRAELAGKMLREDPGAFREMVFAGLRALEAAAQQGSSVGGESAATVAPPFRAASSSGTSPAAVVPQTLGGQTTAPQAAHRQATSQQNSTSQQHAPQHQQNAPGSRVAAYAAFERATNADLERGIGGAIDRSLQAALPNAARSENGAALKERLATAIRQDVEKSLQGDRDLGEQVARIVSGQRLDDATRAQVVRIIGDRAQQLLPGSARKVLADWTQTTLASHSNRAERVPAQITTRSASSNANSDAGAQFKSAPPAERAPASHRAPRKIDYRRVSDDDILGS